MENIENKNIENENKEDVPIQDSNLPTEDVSIQDSKLPTIVFITGIFLLIVIGILGWYVLSTKGPVKGFGEINEVVGADISKDISQGTFDYTIPGVPFIGIYNHIGKISYVRNDADGSIATILEYWNPGETNFATIILELRKLSPGPFIKFAQFKDYINSLGDYVVELEQLEISELKKYVNSELKTPLLFLLPIDERENSKNNFHPATILIGVNELDQKVIVHSFWLGNNYEISFKDFKEMQKKLPVYEQNTYFVIQPKSLNKTLKKMEGLEKIAYPSRGIIMNESLEMVKNYLLGWDAQRAQLFPFAEQSYEEAVNNPKFEKSVPPYFKVLTLYNLAEVKLLLGKNTQAEKYALMAVELNHNLDKPFREDWPGYEARYNIQQTIVDRISIPYRVLGDVYIKLNEFDKAKEAYEEALVVDSNDSKASHGLEFAEINLEPEADLKINKEAFIDILIKKSPWSASWTRVDGYTGTYKISVSRSLADSKLTGRLFDSNRGSNEGFLDDVIVNGNCVSFDFVSFGAKYHYDQCLIKDGLLKGVLNGSNIFATTIYRPSK